MTKNEQTMIELGCPECGGEIELYDTNPQGNGGKYRCKQCNRNTTWSVGESLTFTQLLNEMKKKIDKK